MAGFPLAVIDIYFVTVIADPALVPRPVFQPGTVVLTLLLLDVLYAIVLSTFSPADEMNAVTYPSIAFLMSANDMTFFADIDILTNSLIPYQ